MSFRRDNVIKVDVWVDEFVPDVDGHHRVQLWRAVAPAHVGDVVCLGDGELLLFADVEGMEGAHPTGVVLFKPLLIQTESQRGRIESTMAGVTTSTSSDPCRSHMAGLRQPSARSGPWTDSRMCCDTVSPPTT